MSPLMEEMLHSVLNYMPQSSLEESFLEVFVLGTIFETVECALNSSLQKSIQDLTDRSRAMSLGLVFSLSH